MTGPRPNFATGGIAGAASEQPLPEGAVARRLGGGYVWDGEWFDQMLDRLPGPKITVRFSPNPPPRPA